MNRDLFLAILSMDSYNRSYRQSVLGLSSANGTKIGNALIRSDSSVLQVGDVRQDIPVGFYAIAYNVSGVAGFDAGQQVIAYRGSDSVTRSGSAVFAALTSAGPFPAASTNDIASGYGVAVGIPDGPQAVRAIQFYRAVTGSSAAVQANTILTGHSLGGGLAGLAANDNDNAPAIRRAA